MINRSTYLTADGALNGTAAVAFGNWLQDLVNKGYLNSAGYSNSNPFLDGSVAMYWDGNWDTQGAIDKYGDDVVFLPPPDLGTGIKVGAGSMTIGASAACSADQLKGVEAFIQMSMTDKNIANIATTQGVVPATIAAAALTTLYAPGGRYEVFAQMESKFGTVRPATPGFPAVSTIFDKAVKDILHGADVKSTLDQAVKDIDSDISTNHGYGF